MIDYRNAIIGKKFLLSNEDYKRLKLPTGVPFIVIAKIRGIGGRQSDRMVAQIDKPIASNEETIEAPKAITFNARHWSRFHRVM